ncbi:hypothetical protein [Streptomyces sp. enrichment culture]|uniref:hypothetical protein n=1 Tax=Streptomyces sp. enrichment culture TaxID=1795815 RepID=UPI003F56928E
MTVRGWCRAARAGVFAVACVLLAALGHVTMSGTPVPGWAMAAGLTGTGTAGWLLAGRERGRVLIVAVVTAAQAVLHETFSLAQRLTPARVPGPSPMHAPHGADGMSAHAHQHASASVGADAMAGTDMGAAAHAAHGVGHLPVHDMSAMSGAASVGMLAAHLLAAVVCGLWLAHGERAVFRVLRAAAGRLAAPLRLLLALPTPVSRPTVRRRRFTARPVPVRLLLCSCLTFRGPPPGTAVV